MAPAVRLPAVPVTDAGRPTLAVWKLASCDGCLVTLLDCEDELPALLAAVDVASFPEVTRQARPGPYDISVVEGSVTTPEDVLRVGEIRRASRCLVAVGACATAGGVQALRDTADVAEFARAVYPAPGQVAALARSTPVSSHVTVDLELPGCPVDRGHLLAALGALLHGRVLRQPAHSVCVECKRRGTVCVTVTRDVPCLGPVTRAGCDALCPAHGRGCFGCFGPQEAANAAALTAELTGRGTPVRQVRDLFRGVVPGAEAFRREAARLDGDPPVPGVAPPVPGVAPPVPGVAPPGGGDPS